MQRLVATITLVTFISATLLASPCMAADDVSDGSLWAKVAPLLATAGDEAAAAEVEAPASYVPWQQRRGPAYPDDNWRSLGRYAQELPYMAWDDTKSVFTNRTVLISLAVAGAAGIAINGSGVDETIDDRTRGHRQLSKGLDGIGGFFGSPAVHFPLAVAMHATGLWTDDTKLYEVSKTLMNALIINGVTTQTLKWATRTESPNGDELGWPSGHTSSSFCVAAVINEAYGPWVGVPLYAFATFVGYERIDARNHDFSDVVSGAIMGAVIGYAVATDHEPRIFGMDVMPMAGPDGTVGLMLAKQW